VTRTAVSIGKSLSIGACSSTPDKPDSAGLSELQAQQELLSNREEALNQRAADLAARESSLSNGATPVAATEILPPQCSAWSVLHAGLGTTTKYQQNGKTPGVSCQRKN